MPEMAARPLHLCLPLQKIPREARLLQEAPLHHDYFVLFCSQNSTKLMLIFGSRKTPRALSCRAWIKERMLPR